MRKAGITPIMLRAHVTLIAVASRKFMPKLHRTQIILLLIYVFFVEVREGELRFVLLMRKFPKMRT